MSATRPPSFDERYAAPVEASRRGAHRARPNPLTSALPVVAGVAVVLLVVVGAWALLGRGNGGGGGGTTPPAATEPSVSAPPSAGSEVPQPSASASPSATTEPSPSAEESEGAAEVDRAGTEVRVLNSVSVSGLAREAAEVLEGKDWGIGKVGDSKQRNLEVTRVYYEDDEGAEIAEAIVADLGYGEAKQSPGANAGPTGFTVVLGQDAADAAESAN